MAWQKESGGGGPRFPISPREELGKERLADGSHHHTGPSLHLNTGSYHRPWHPSGSGGTRLYHYLRKSPGELLTKLGEESGNRQPRQPAARVPSAATTTAVQHCLWPPDVMQHNYVSTQCNLKDIDRCSETGHISRNVSLGDPADFTSTNLDDLGQPLPSALEALLHGDTGLGWFD